MGTSCLVARRFMCMASRTAYTEPFLIFASLCSIRLGCLPPTGRRRLLSVHTNARVQVATIPLQGLLDAASQPGAAFEVVAVVSQPPRARGRGRKAPLPSPVHQLALDRGLPDSAILTPTKAREVPITSTNSHTLIVHQAALHVRHGISPAIACQPLASVLTATTHSTAVTIVNTSTETHTRSC